MDNGHIHVRDLYERDLHRAPFFGGAASEKITAEYQKVSGPSLSNLQKNLLLRKLSDIEAWRPCLGTLFTRAIGSYTWVLESEALGLLPEQDVVRHFPDERRVQLANRYINTIHIHRESWQRLSDEAKVALIIHEIVYGMMSVQRSDKNLFTQNMEMTREVTALFFRRSENLSPQNQALLEQAFDFNSIKPLACEDRFEPIVISIGSAPLNHKKQFEIRDLENQKSVENGISDLCANLRHAKDRTSLVYDFQSTRFTSSSLSFTRLPTAREGVRGFLYWLQITPPPFGAIFRTCDPAGNPIPAIESCEEFFHGLIHDWKGTEFFRFRPCR